MSRLPFLRHSTSNNGVTLKSMLEVGGQWRSLKMVPFESLI